MRSGARNRSAAALAGVLAVALPALAKAQMMPDRTLDRPPTVPFVWLHGALRPPNPSRITLYRPLGGLAPVPAPEPGVLHRPPLDRRADLDAVAMSCVPFARAVSGIDVRGNAADWWENAAGSYARGKRPEPGSVLSFQAIERMPLGHVAVVTKIVSRTQIVIDHANWDEAGTVARDVPVTDVSPNNDWTQVRVDAARDGDYGAIYPTDGFIYNHAGAVPALSASAGERAPAARPAPGLPVVVNGPGGGAFSLAGLWTGKLARPRVFTPRGLAAD